MAFKDKIYKEICDMGKGSVGELSRRLNLSTHNGKKILKNLLDELYQEGRISVDRKGNVTAKRVTLIQGELKGNKRGFAFLIREDGGEDMFIPPRCLNGAMHGDTVAVRQTGESEGEVVTVVKRGIGRLVGTYEKLTNYGFVIPDDSNYFKDIFVAAENSKNAPDKSKVVVEIRTDKDGKRYGEIIEVLGKAGERNADVLSILLNYGFSQTFPESVLKASQNIKYEEDNEGRKDLTNLLTITIDGEDAKDFDDAISLTREGDSYRLYVHIADVSHYVRPGDVIDREAYERGTSVYFPESVFPMLPESLSNGVCSLRPGEEKLTLTIEMLCDGGGNVQAADFYKSVIKSDYRMTYTAVTGIFDGDENLKEKYKDLCPMLSEARTLAANIKKKRDDGGAINFTSHECKIILDNEGEVTDIKPYPYAESNSLIEQFMVLANETVAKRLSESRVPSVYRVHKAPDPEKMEAFVDFIHALGLDLNLYGGVKPKLLSDFLEEIKDNPASYVINKMLLKSMQKAKYSPDNAGHFGLNLDYYCHFTSPIRRYPDLMAHRALKALIEKKADAQFKDKFARYCADASVKSSEREIAAEHAEWDIDDYYKAVYMSKKIGERFSGIVSGIVTTGIFVALPNTVEGFIAIDDLPSDRYEIDEKHRLKGYKYVFSIGAAIDVEIKSANPSEGQINMLFAGSAETYIERPKKKKEQRRSFAN